MTRAEADAMARAIETIDGGCPVCIARFCKELNEADVGFDFEFDDEKDRVSVISRSSNNEISHLCARVVIECTDDHETVECRECGRRWTEPKPAPDAHDADAPD